MKLSPKLKYELFSAANTVVSAMTVELGVQAAIHHELFDPTMLSKQLLVAVGLSLIRAGWKALLQFLLSFTSFKTPKAV